MARSTGVYGQPGSWLRLGNFNCQQHVTHQQFDIASHAKEWSECETTHDAPSQKAQYCLFHQALCSKGFLCLASLSLAIHVLRSTECPVSKRDRIYNAKARPSSRNGTLWNVQAKGLRGEVELVKRLLGQLASVANEWRNKEVAIALLALSQ